MTSAGLLAVVAAGNTQPKEVIEETTQTTETFEAAVEAETITEVMAPQPIVNVPMDAVMQGWLFDYCEIRAVDPYLILAIIDTESGFNPAAQNGTCIGMMQINADVHQGLLESMGLDDFYNPYQNIMVGIELIKSYLDTGNGLDWALMTYNGGRAYATEKIQKGEVTDYVWIVKEKKESYQASSND